MVWYASWNCFGAFLSYLQFLDFWGIREEKGDMLLVKIHKHYESVAGPIIKEHVSQQRCYQSCNATKKPFSIDDIFYCNDRISQRPFCSGGMLQRTLCPFLKCFMGPSQNKEADQSHCCTCWCWEFGISHYRSILVKPIRKTDCRRTQRKGRYRFS